MAAAAVVATIGIAALAASGSSSTSKSTNTSASSTGESGSATTSASSTPTARQVAGQAATLGAGNFSVGSGVQPGLYDVTAGPGQSGNFMVNGGDSYNEVLGQGPDNLGVPKIRAKLQSGDSIKIDGLSQVSFTPVTTPFVTTHSPALLYAGTWTVGQDIGAGRYVATPGSGQSGNFMVESEGVNEVLGPGPDNLGVPNVTTTLKKGDVITISGLSQVTMTPQ